MEKKIRPFGMRDKIGYMFGDFGNDFTFILSSSFMLKFYTDVMGIGAAVVGMLMMAARFIDAITDVTMGQIVDRSKPTEDGKFRPWIRRICGPVAISSFLIYQSGLADYILDFCGKDYERLVRMLERTMSFENLTDLIKSIQAIDLKELRKTVEELKDITKDVDPELVKNMADIMRFNDPNLSKLSDNLKENAADEAFKDKEDKEDLPKA